jgi:uncharacterized protein with ParB-like and HNH nuclease domain/predicted transport protein
MKATEAKLLDFLKKSPQFVIPIYQRTYSWTEKECQQLWNDIVRCGSSDDIAVHFVGSIVYVESGLSQVTHQAPLMVIDGQQRLTSVSLLLAALANAIGDSEPFDGFTSRKIRNYYLLNPEESGDRHFKLILSQTDKATLTSLISGIELPREHSERIQSNYEVFTDWLESGKTDLATVCRGLAKLIVVDVALNRDQDNPQLIFESMNSTGKALSQADLIRNFILMGLEPNLQSQLYERFWRPMEVEFGQKAYSDSFDSFMRHYLTVVTGDIPNINAVYDAFKMYAHKVYAQHATDGTQVETLVRQIRDYSKYYCAIVLGGEDDRELKEAFQDLRDMKVDVAVPFLLELYYDYKQGLLTKSELLGCIRLTEAYVFRRLICQLASNTMNKTFAIFTKSVNKDTYYESVQAQFMLLTSYRRFPTDEEFKRNLISRDLFNLRRGNYWLRRLENQGRKELVNVDEYTIEHILPQNENLSQGWIRDLGPNWQDVQQTWKHTLGNLTLTAYNSEFSDRPFLEKRDMPSAPGKGLRFSPLALNQDFAQCSTWNEETILARAARLTDIARIVWNYPTLSQETVENHRPVKKQGKYTISDHKHLQSGHTKDLFTAFRSRVLEIDSCVVEEFLKLYVAYKAETNFVDAVPQAKSLRLSLNTPFKAISDPRGICRDVSNTGRWGNGDVEVQFTSLTDLPYIMQLVRQAFDYQLSGGGDA